MTKKLFDYVHEILSQQDTLVVPDFGAFILQKTTTFLNDADYISIVFTAQQQHDDGVLKKYIANNSSLSEDEIEDYISASLEEVYLEINNTGIYKVEGIGEFRAINDSIVFKPFDEQYLKKVSTQTEKTESTEKKVLSLEEAAAAFLEAEGLKQETDSKVQETLSREQETENVKQETENVKQETESVMQELESRMREVENTKQDAEAVSKPIDFKKLFTPLIILVIVVILGGTFYFFRNEIANLNKPTITNDTSQVASEENMQQLSDTLAEINTPTVSEEQSVSTPEQPISPAPYTDNNTAPNNNTTNKNVILRGANTVTMYYVAIGSYNSIQDARIEKQNLDVTGFVAKIIETTTGKKYHVIIAEFTDEASAMEELKFSKKIDNKFYLMTVKPNDK